MANKEILAKQAELEAAYQAARASGNKEAAMAASAALSAFIMANNPPKVNGWSSRAGKRQQQMRQAEQQMRQSGQYRRALLKERK